MKHDPIASGKRKAVNVSLDTGVVAYARQHGINLSQTCEAALRAATKQELDRRWGDENREWVDSYNRWVEENGLPLADLRVL